MTNHQNTRNRVRTKEHHEGILWANFPRTGTQAFMLNPSRNKDVAMSVQDWLKIRTAQRLQAVYVVGWMLTDAVHRWWPT